MLGLNAVPVFKIIIFSTFFVAIFHSDFEIQCDIEAGFNHCQCKFFIKNSNKTMCCNQKVNFH